MMDRVYAILMRWFLELRNREEGQAAVEYGVLVALIIAVCVASSPRWAVRFRPRSRPSRTPCRADAPSMRRLWQQDGQAAIEYAVLAALVSIAAVTLMATIGIQVQGLFQPVVGLF